MAANLSPTVGLLLNEESINIPQTTAALHALHKQPFIFGKACAELLRHIAFLVSKHLDHTSGYTSNPPACIVPAEEFVTAIDTYLFEQRDKDGKTEAFPNELYVDRKQRAYTRKWQRRYNERLEEMFKATIHKELGSVLGGINVDQTKEFNRGVDKVLNGTQWKPYPSVNVALEPVDTDWAVWLKTRCERLGLEYLRRGESALVDL